MIRIELCQMYWLWGYSCVCFAYEQYFTRNHLPHAATYLVFRVDISCRRLHLLNITNSHLVLRSAVQSIDQVV